MRLPRRADRTGMNRRGFFAAFLAGTVIPLAVPFLEKLPGTNVLRRFLRPPGAKPEKAFLDACIGCGQCANVCPNKCITLYGLEKGLENFATPRIAARARGCILCMACTQVCPTGALEPLEATDEGMRAVAMGTAFVSESICYSFAGRTCGACYRACPLPGEAMTIGLFEKPYVHEEFCVGCGLCEQGCIHMPQAIRVIPTEELRSYEEA